MALVGWDASQAEEQEVPAPAAARARDEFDA